MIVFVSFGSIHSTSPLPSFFSHSCVDDDAGQAHVALVVFFFSYFSLYLKSYLYIANQPLLFVYISLFSSYRKNVVSHSGFVPWLLQRLHLSFQSVNIVVILVITFAVTTSRMGTIAARSDCVSVENCPI